MDFGLTDEQRSIVEVTRSFVERELYPHEEEVERTGVLRPELAAQIRQKALAAGLYAANMPEEVGGAGLDTVTWVLYEKELGRANYALQYCGVPRPSNILLAGTEAQREKYLYPTVRGEKIDCLAMTEPSAGSDMRGMRTKATRDDSVIPGGWRIKGSKHFISHADEADFVILVAVTGADAGSDAGGRVQMTTFLVDLDTPGVGVHDGYRNVSHRGYTNSILDFDDVHVGDDAVLGEVGKGFELSSEWLGSTRLQVAASCLGRAERALELSVQHAATREQFGQPIGRFQGVGFKLADMATELRAAELITLHAAWKVDQGTATDADIAMAKVKATEMLAMVADEAIQIHGGMGLMDELPLERIWRDARIERIWDGTSEIQRHIISRSMLRPLGG
jgi:acyl-CoA dehydrogenase